MISLLISLALRLNAWRLRCLEARAAFLVRMCACSPSWFAWGSVSPISNRLTMRTYGKKHTKPKKPRQVSSGSKGKPTSSKRCPAVWPQGDETGLRPHSCAPVPLLLACGRLPADAIDNSALKSSLLFENKNKQKKQVYLVLSGRRIRWVRS